MGVIELLRQGQRSTIAVSRAEGDNMARLLPVVCVLMSVFPSSQTPHLVQAETDTPRATEELTTDAPHQPAVPDGIEVTFAPTYGALQDGSWKIPVRGWVHKTESEEHVLKTLAHLVCPE